MRTFTIVSTGGNFFSYEEGIKYNKTVYYSKNLKPHFRALDFPYIIVQTDNANLITMLDGREYDAIKLAVEIIKNQYPEDILDEYAYERF